MSRLSTKNQNPRSPGSLHYFMKERGFAKFWNLRHFMLRSLLLRRIFITKSMTTVPFDKSKFMIWSLCWSWSEKFQPWERDTKYYSLLELCYKWVSREPSLTPFLSLQIKCNNLWNLTLKQQHTHSDDLSSKVCSQIMMCIFQKNPRLLASMRAQYWWWMSQLIERC